MKRSTSFERMAHAGETLRDSALGSTQRQHLKGRDPSKRSLLSVLWRIIVLLAFVLVLEVLYFGIPVSELPALIEDVATLKRVPATGLDNSAAALGCVLAFVPLIVIDNIICMPLLSDDGARWFLLHALANMIVVVLSLPDFYYTFQLPQQAISVKYCKSLPFPACNDLATCVIVAVHGYHMLGFKLSSEDIFHHILFVPIIAGIHFVYPWGVVGNILGFFISGLPGGISYFLLAAVKSGHLSPLREKRINCSINTWIRGPGITIFCTLCISAWCNPPEDMRKDEQMPAYVILPVLALCFFNGQFYAQRVIGNYYIRKAQDYHKRGIQKVELHSS